jgi:hypothetical protein
MKRMLPYLAVYTHELSFNGDSVFGRINDIPSGERHLQAA